MITTRAFTEIDSPVGRLRLVADDEGLRRIDFVRDAGLPDPSWRSDSRALREASRQLDAWFAGERRDFELALAPEGTEFQRSVWEALLSIPYGGTSSYGEIAARIGRPGAARAVGAANGANPIPIVIPCHRVIGRSGALVGYGGGLDVKVALLAIERGQALLTAMAPLARASRTRGR